MVERARQEPEAEESEEAAQEKLEVVDLGDGTDFFMMYQPPRKVEGRSETVSDVDLSGSWASARKSVGRGWPSILVGSSSRALDRATDRLQKEARRRKTDVGPTPTVDHESPLRSTDVAARERIGDLSAKDSARFQATAVDLLAALRASVAAAKAVRGNREERKDEAGGAGTGDPA